jgi:two-component system sensor histidine kinase KdpD
MGQAIEISVADRGRGIPPGEEERIFDKFYRLERGGVSGAGIGLSICRGIVQAHGGRVWVEQRDGGGSVFRFTLPVEPRDTLDRA